MSVHWPILRRCLAAPMRVAVVDDQRSYRGIDLAVGALQVAGALAGVSNSRAVGVLLPTGGAFPIAALAGWICGKVVVPLNYLLKPHELRYVVDDCGADTVVSAQPLLDFMGESAASALRGRSVLRLEDVDFKGVPDIRWPSVARADDLAVLLYTSGTSGRPKGVMLTHGNLGANISQVRRHADFDRGDVLLGVLPQFHTFGLTVLTLMPLSVGCRVVYTARFVPGKLIRLMRQHRPTAFVAIPSMYNALLHVKDAGPDDLRSLRFAVSGGEPLPGAVSDAFFQRFGVRINEGYGLTETSPVTNICLPGEYRPGSVGRPLPGITETIIDIESGEETARGHDGEIRIAGPNVMRGYFKLPEETAAAFDARGFFRTGDLGRLDPDGHLFITGRLKEMIIVGGENVFPREIEEVLNRHPSVKDSGVIGATDPVRGELPVAFVEMRETGHEGGDHAAFEEKALLAWCRQHLAGYKVPREVRCVGALPRNATGKVLRRELKQLLG